MSKLYLYIAVGRSDLNEIISSQLSVAALYVGLPLNKGSL